MPFSGLIPQLSLSHILNEHPGCRLTIVPASLEDPRLCTRETGVSGPVLIFTHDGRSRVLLPNRMLRGIKDISLRSEFFEDCGSVNTLRWLTERGYVNAGR